MEKVEGNGLKDLVKQYCTLQIIEFLRFLDCTLLLQNQFDQTIITKYIYFLGSRSIFASCSVDCSVKIWDTKSKNEPLLKDLEVLFYLFLSAMYLY